VCPRCGNGREFHAKAVERHYWLIDAEGCYLEDLECYDSSIFEVICPRCNAVVYS
jgi:hypothetical protein